MWHLGAEGAVGRTDVPVGCLLLASSCPLRPGGKNEGSAAVVKDGRAKKDSGGWGGLWRLGEALPSRPAGVDLQGGTERIDGVRRQCLRPASRGGVTAVRRQSNRLPGEAVL